VSEEFKLMVTRTPKGEIEIVGNRAGLLGLAEMCEGLAGLTDDEARTAANHWHVDEAMNNAEPGSMPLKIRIDPDL
jgi:hypothetical protein